MESDIFRPIWVQTSHNAFIIHFLQVGGHTRLLLLNQSTVIKPLNLRELEFYQNIPSDIQQFVPKYRGECMIHF